MRKLVRQIITLPRKFEQWVCAHPREKQIRRMKDGRMFLECMGCLHQSPGVQTR